MDILKKQFILKTNSWNLWILKNSVISDSHILLLNISDKINLKRNDKYVALPNLSIYYTWKIMKRSCKSNKFTISTTTWNEEVELDDRSYSVSYMQDYFEYIIKTCKTFIDNPVIKIYVNKIENRITFKIKTGYYVEILTPDTTEWLRSTKE